jgi:hypothetical protein
LQLAGIANPVLGIDAGSTPAVVDYTLILGEDLYFN